MNIVFLLLATRKGPMTLLLQVVLVTSAPQICIF